MSKRNKNKNTKDKVYTSNTIDDKINKSGVITTDAFSNPVYSMGFGSQNPIEGTIYPNVRITQNYILLDSLYRNNWIVQSIIKVIPEDMIKNWFQFTGRIDQDQLNKYKKIERTTKLKESISQGLRWGRLYGGAAGLIKIEGHDNLEEPLDLNLIMPGSFKGLFIVDRWSGIYPGLELIKDINDPDFGLPEYYEIRDERGVFQYRVHHSRIVRFIGNELPFYERIIELYWGQSVLEPVYEELKKRDNVSYNMAGLTFKANLSVYEMENLDQVLSLADPVAQSRFYNTLQAQSKLESNFGMRVINKGDSIQTMQYNFAGLKDIYETIQQDISGASRIPVRRLFGKTAGGLNSTGESELQIYYDYIEQEKESSLRPILEKILPIIALSAWGEIPDDLEFKFNPTRTLTEEDISKITASNTKVKIDAFEANGITQKQFVEELMKEQDTSGIFSTISQDTLDKAEDKFLYEIQGMHDPLVGNIDMLEQDLDDEVVEEDIINND